MSKKKAMIGIGVTISLSLAIISVFIASLPYHKSGWSGLYFEADLTKIYGRSLGELKQAYTELISLDHYYEINDQFLEISYPAIEDECLYGFEYGTAETWTDDRGTIYPAKCFQLSKNCFSDLGIGIEQGRPFSMEDMEHHPTKRVPMIVGHAYQDRLGIGDEVKGRYIQDELTYEVIGILEEGAAIDLSGRSVELDRYLVIPSFDIADAPASTEDDMFQVRHYANKLSGKLHYRTFWEFLREYLTIWDINEHRLRTEGRIIY